MHVQYYSQALFLGFLKYVLILMYMSIERFGQHCGLHPGSWSLSTQPNPPPDRFGCGQTSECSGAAVHRPEVSVLLDRWPEQVGSVRA